jgi:short-subunit dehydrogenase
MMMETPKRVAVISGAAHGIGKATALILVEHINALILMDIDEQGLSGIKNQIREKIGNNTTVDIDAYPVDVTRETKVKEVLIFLSTP